MTVAIAWVLGFVALTLGIARHHLLGCAAYAHG